MGKKSGGVLSKQITIRLSEREGKKLEQYCLDNDISSSEYFRCLLRIHLGLSNDLKEMFDLPLPTKK